MYSLTVSTGDVILRRHYLCSSKRSNFIMVFTEEDKCAIKLLRLTKNYSAKRFLLEFPE